MRHIVLKAILWDNDGILVDTEHLYFEATRQVLASRGIPLTEAQYVQLFLVEGRGAWHLAAERGAPPVEVQQMREERSALYARLLAEAPRVIPGIADVLEGLRHRYVMGVVTSSRKDHFDLLHQASGLRKYFDFVVAAGDYTRSKPDPEPYVRALERCGVDREACVAIEDSERGLRAATAAGLRCIVVPNGLTRQGRFEAAHRILTSVAEIPAALSQLATS